MKNKKYLSSAIGILLLMQVAFYNGYPLVTSDSGAYINHAFLWSVPLDRPVFYSMFIFFSSLHLSLWLTVFVQCAIFVALFRLLLSSIISKNEVFFEAYFLGCTFILAFFTGLSWCLCQIMPDIFTLIGVLCFAIILLQKEKTASKKNIFLIALFVFSECCHNSNLLTFLGLAVGTSLFCLFFYKNLYKKSLILIGFSLSAWFFVPTVHWVLGGGFTLNSRSNHFLFAKMVENGLAKDFLYENCSNNEYKMCAFKDQLPTDAMQFLWDENSPMMKTGGWDANTQEYQNILKKIVTSPDYLWRFVKKSAVATVKQLNKIHIGDGLNAHTENSNPFWKIQQHFGRELPLYTTAKQYQSKLEFSDITFRQLFFNSLCFILLLWLMYRVGLASFDKEDYFIFLICILAIILNAFATGALANILARLQGRIMILFPIVSLLMLIKYRKFLVEKA